MYILLIIIITPLVIGLVLLHKNAHIPPYPLTDTPDMFNLPFEKISFTTSDEINIKGWFLKQAFPVSSTIIVCHGLGTNKSDVLPFAGFLFRGGYNILLFDFRGHGESEESICSFGPCEENDLKGAVDYLKQYRPAEAKKIGILGGSMGAAIALSFSKKSPDISAIVSDCSFSDLPSALIHHVHYFYHIPKYPFGYIMLVSYALYFRKNPADFSPVKSLQQNPHLKGVLLIHGSHDAQILPSNAQKLYDSALCPKDLVIAPGASHFESYSVLGRQYEEKVLAFFKQYL